MKELFLGVLNMSVTACFVIAAVCLIRLILMKAPKKYAYLLWSVVGFRLICPISFSSVFSIFNVKSFEAAAMRAGAQMQEIIPANTGNAVVPQAAAGVYGNAGTALNNLPAVPTAAITDPLQTLLTIGMLLWLAGIAALLIYSVITYVKLHRRMATAVMTSARVFESDGLRSPFVLGLFRPRIYIPFGLGAQEKAYILQHEHCHIQRCDYVLKPLAFLILTVHWFNPLVWLAFMLLTKDMEMSCDEKVLALTGSEIKQNYSASLLSFAVNRRFPGASPLAFGESGVKGRIKNVLRFRKPKLWITVSAVLLCLAVFVACATDASVNKNTPSVSIDDAREKYPWAMVPFPDSYLDTVEIVSHQVENGVFVEAYHTASRDAGGLLFRLARHTPAAFEDYWVEQYKAGNPVSHFATDDWYYYSYELAADVQYAPEDASTYAVLIDELCRFIIPRMMEQNNLTPYDQSTVEGAEYTYPGNHAIVSFTLLDGSKGKLILSQPVYQNSRGIWCVERQSDTAGMMYPVLPDTDLTALEYYTQLQNEYDAGERQLLRPDETAADYLSGVLKLEPYPLSMSTYNEKDLREEQIKNLEAFFKDGGFIWYQEDFRQSSLPDASVALWLEMDNSGDNVVDFAYIREMFENCSWTPAVEEPVVPPGKALYLGDDSVNCFIFIPGTDHVTYIEDHATVTYTVKSASGGSLTDLMLNYFPD